MATYDIFGLDYPCMDLNVNLDRIPERNGGSRLNDLSFQGGGKVSSGMVAAARLGASCALGGILGDDIFGRFCYQDFVRHGINVDNMKIRDGCDTGLSIVVSEKESQTRSFLFRMGQCPPLREEEVDWSYLKNAKYLFIADASELTRKAVKIARENGVKVFIDADHYTDALYNLIPEIDYFVGSEFVFDSIFPGSKEKGFDNLREECEKLRAMGPEAVVFTFGEHGCIGLDDEGYFRLPAFQVDVRDTVGAGDVFHGAFLAALLQGLSLKECSRYASGTSAIKCTRPGGRAGIPNPDTLRKFLDEGIIDYTEIDQRVEYYRRGLEYV